MIYLTLDMEQANLLRDVTAWMGVTLGEQDSPFKSAAAFRKTSILLSISEEIEHVIKKEILFSESLEESIKGVSNARN